MVLSFMFGGKDFVQHYLPVYLFSIYYTFSWPISAKTNLISLFTQVGALLLHIVCTSQDITAYYPLFINEEYSFNANLNCAMSIRKTNCCVIYLFIILLYFPLNLHIPQHFGIDITKQ